MRALVLVLAGCWVAAPAPAVKPPDPPKPKVQETLVREAGSPAFMLQVGATHMYWIGGGTDDEGVFRAEKKPYAEPVRLASTDDALGLMLVGERLWWGDGKTVFSMAATGGTVQKVVDQLPGDVVDIAVFGTDLYAISSGRAGKTELRQFTLDGKPVATRDIDGHAPIIIAKPEGLYVGTERQLTRIAGTIDATAKVVELADSVEVQAIFVDTDAVLFGTPGAILRAPRTGPGTATVIARAPGAVSDVGADDRYIYWGVTLDDDSGNVIWRAPKAGGRGEVFARVTGEPGTVIVDGEHVYWANTTNGKIVRRRRDATPN